MRKAFVFVSFLLSCGAVFAQAVIFTNNGADIYVTDGALMIAKGGSLENNINGGQGKMDNQGTIVVEGFVLNGGTINGSGDTIRLSGDWINNGTYTTNGSWVDMYGGGQQISGGSITTFDSLNLSGGGFAKQQTVNAVTASLLALNDEELGTNGFEMLISNPGTAAITRNNGFVSSTGAGKLSWATNAASPYFFPLGSPSYVNAPSIFRPIEFTPSSAAPNTYGAALIKKNATFDGFDIKTVDTILCEVNPNFYHKLYHSAGGDAAAVKMFYKAVDGEWSDQGHWDTPNRWNYFGTSTTGSVPGFSTVSVAGVNDFSTEAFALAKQTFKLDAGPDETITVGQTIQLKPTIGTNAIDTLLWTPAGTLSCDDCASPVATPTTTMYYTIFVKNTSGCKNTDSVLINVLPAELLVPTAFSPNGDGANDFFRALNKNLTKYNIQVYDRWGVKLFETSDITEGWDGVYKGMHQELGVYIWMCQYQIAGNPKIQTARGNVTLLR